MQVRAGEAKVWSEATSFCRSETFGSSPMSRTFLRNRFARPITNNPSARRFAPRSLAESAERLSYSAWLHKAASTPNPLHVVYINTSLESKAQSNSIVPTVTCTSSNVVKTMLQASLQISDVGIYYGPDTCMGYNLQTMFDKILQNWTDEDVKSKLHPLHTLSSIARLRRNLHVYPSGNCVVHQMFGNKVVEYVKEHYKDAYVTAHLEVPGEMFEIAMEASLTDRGVVGSTSDILNFITGKVEEAARVDKGGKQTLKFVLGTEAGMVTSIVRNVKNILRTVPNASERVEAEVVFPVADEAVAIDDQAEGGIVPGVKGGEGCGTNGGCATCPFMKMNDLDGVIDIMERYKVGKGEGLEGNKPPQRLVGKTVRGRDATEAGVEPILRMRTLMSSGGLGEELVELVCVEEQVIWHPGWSEGSTRAAMRERPDCLVPTLKRARAMEHPEHENISGSAPVDVLQRVACFC